MIRSETSLASFASFCAYSVPAAVSWIEHGPTTKRKRWSSVKIRRWISSRARATKAACDSVLGSSTTSWAGEGRTLVSTTLMSDVFCMEERRWWIRALSCKPPRSDILDSRKEVGRSPTPKRPALCFLSYPKTSAKRKKCGKSNEGNSAYERSSVNKIFEKYCWSICKPKSENNLPHVRFSFSSSIFQIPADGRVESDGRRCLYVSSGAVHAGSSPGP